ncbi:MAG TPA: hypothetical protein VF950_23815 [Planctomycetota bacterium]
MLVKPAIRRIAHARDLRLLSFDGATPRRSLLGFSGLHIERVAWEADVVFKPIFEKGGHTHFKADLKRATPDVEFRSDQGGALALTPKGDEAFAEKLLTSAMRDRLLRLGALGGRLWYVRGGILEIVGPLASRDEELRPFLTLCAEIADLAVEALSK